jgi:probable HAF family extracellular repeat protein
MVELPTLGGMSTYPLDINDLGQVVGYDYTTAGDTHAFVWSEAEGMRDLGTLGGQSSEAHSINNDGQIVGQSTNASGQTHAVLWTVNVPPPPPPLPPPVAPSGATARPASSTSVTVSWVDNSTNEGGFSVQRSLDAGQSWAQITRTEANVTSYSDGDRSSDAQACYRVLAFNRGGESAPSNTACTAPPAAPTSLTATTDAAAPWSKVNLAWADNSGVEDGYEIQRCTGSACADYAVIATAAANTTRYTDATVTEATDYSYRVRSTKDGGGSEASNTASVTTGIDPNAAPVARYTWKCTNTSCTFDGTTSTDDSGITGYSWTFGDGGTAAGRTASHTYAARGTYTVTLTVRDNGAPAKTGSAACSVSATNGKNAGSCK